MSYLKIIANTVYEDCALIDTLPSSISGTATDLNPISGGPRYLHLDPDSSTYQIGYINKKGNLSADTAVLTRSDIYEGHKVELKSYSTYSSSSSTIYTTNAFTGSIGLNDEDFIYEFTLQENKQAFALNLEGGTGGSYDIKVHQVFFGKAVQIDFTQASIIRNPIKNTIKIEGQFHHVSEVLTIKLEGISKETLQEIENLNIHKRTYFLYDSSGVHLSDKLYYGVSDRVRIDSIFDDLYSIELDIFRLRKWSF